MVVHREDLQSMKQYLAERMQATGQFSTIDPKLGRAFKLMASQKQRGIYLEGGEGRFLIYCHADPFPSNRNLFKEQTMLGRQGVHTENVLYSGDVFFRWDRAPFKARRVGTAAQRRRYITTKKLERSLNTRHGGVTYFKPGRRVLEQVRLIGGVQSDYTVPETVRNEYGVEELVESRAPEWVESRELTTVMDHEVLKTLRCPGLDQVGFYDDGLDASIRGLLEREAQADEDERYDVGERIGIMLDSCDERTLRRMTRKFGQAALGGYAVYDSP